jgi:hypothetical protein
MHSQSKGLKSTWLTTSLLPMLVLLTLFPSGLSCVSKGTYEKLASERSSIQSELADA